MTIFPKLIKGWIVAIKNLGVTTQKRGQAFGSLSLRGAPIMPQSLWQNRVRVATNNSRTNNEE